MYPTTLFAALVALSPSLAAAQVVGTAHGFATGVTGGGSAKAAAPSDIAQLVLSLNPLITNCDQPRCTC